MKLNNFKFAKLNLQQIISLLQNYTEKLNKYCPRYKLKKLETVYDTL